MSTPAPVRISTARQGKSGYFFRWVCESGHQHRTEVAATKCSERTVRRIREAGTR